MYRTTERGASRRSRPMMLSLISIFALPFLASGIGCGPPAKTGPSTNPRQRATPRAAPRATPPRTNAVANVRRVMAKVLARVKKRAKSQEQPLEKILLPEIKKVPKHCQGEGYFRVHEIPTRKDELPGFLLLGEHGQVPCGAVATACLVSAVQTKQGPVLQVTELKTGARGAKGDDLELSWKRRAGCIIATLKNYGTANCHSPGATMENVELFAFQQGKLRLLLPQVMLKRSGGMDMMEFKGTLKWLPAAAGKEPILQITGSNQSDADKPINSSDRYKLNRQCKLDKLR